MISSLMAALAATTMQSADDVQARCEAYQAEHGGAVDCECLGKLVAADDDLLAELMAMTKPEDMDGASNEMKLTVKACTEA